MSGIIEPGTFKVVFLGTGVSTAVPTMSHILRGYCTTCFHALNVSNSKNKRNNVSIAILFPADESSGVKSASECLATVAVSSPNPISDFVPSKNHCVLIDAGKTMRDACMRVLPLYGIRSVDSILLTHGHADAIMGLDDVRDFQVCEMALDPKTNQSGFRVLSGKIEIYLHQETMETVSQCFGYLTSTPSFLDEEQTILTRRVALLGFNVIEYNSTFNVHGLKIRSFPVYHGGEYISLGFSIGQDAEFVYISDVKLFPAETLAYLQSLPRIKYLVLDCLNLEFGIFSHLGLLDALEVIKLLKPHRVLFIGMSCCFGDHDEMNEQLKEIVRDKLRAEIAAGAAAGAENTEETTQSQDESDIPIVELAFDGLEVSGCLM